MPDSAVKNVVLVHGSFADGSGYRAVYQELTAQGYRVTVVQNPLTSLAADAAATRLALDRQDGPTVLAGHSWGGAVITEAGNHPNVAALVYLAAFQPDKGESAFDWFQKAPPAPENGVLPPDAHGIVYYDMAKFHAGFCADVDAQDAAFMAASQGAFAGSAFTTPLTQAAWHDKPTYAVLATEDKSINPDIQHLMYGRSNTNVTEVKGSHCIYISQPKIVAEVIMEAARNAG